MLAEHVYPNGLTGEIMADPKWLDLARAELGTKELAGNQDNPEILGYYKSAGHPEIKHDETAWCAGFACAMLERSGYASPKTLSARDFMRWGKKLDKPKPGCIAVFTRGDPRSYQGHVGFWLGEDEKGIQLLAGNQGDAVSVAYESKARLLGYRWPVTATNSRTSKSVVAGTIGAVATGAASAVQIIASSPEQSMGIASELKSLASSAPILGIVGSVLVMTTLAIIAWAHFSDLQKNGK